MELFIREEEFKNLLIEWLVYHNSSKRHHFSLNLKSPLQYILNNYKMANMCLTNTINVKVQKHIGLKGVKRIQ